MMITIFRKMPGEAVMGSRFTIAIQEAAPGEAVMECRCIIAIQEAAPGEGEKTIPSGFLVTFMDMHHFIFITRPTFFGTAYMDMI